MRSSSSTHRSRLGAPAGARRCVSRQSVHDGDTADVTTGVEVEIIRHLMPARVYEIDSPAGGEHGTFAIAMATARGDYASHRLSRSLS